MLKVRKLLRGLAVSTALTLCACSLITPYDWSDNFDVHRFKEPVNGAANPDTARGDLKESLNFADGVRREYLGAAQSQATLSTLAGPALIPMAGGAAALGAQGIGDGAITQLSIAGAALYATATWLRSPPREHVYLLGAAAIRCITTAAGPAVTFMGRYHDPLDTILSSKPDGLRAKLDAAIRAKTQVEHDLAAIKNGPDLVSVQAWLDGDVTSDTTKAETSLDSATKLLVSFSTTATAVVNSVEAVEDNVNDIVRQTLPSLSDLSGAFDQVKAAANPVPTTTPQPTNGGVTAQRAPAIAGARFVGDMHTALELAATAAPNSLDKLVADVEILKTALAALDEPTRDIANMVAFANALSTQSSSATAACTVDPSEVALIRALPSDLTIDSTKVQTYVVTLDGKGPYTNAWYGIEPDSTVLKLDPVILTGQTFSFTVKLLKAPATALTQNLPYAILVRDAAGNPIQVHVMLTPAAK